MRGFCIENGLWGVRLGFEFGGRVQGEGTYRCGGLWLKTVALRCCGRGSSGFGGALGAMPERNNMDPEGRSEIQ